jgi:hypothetical protein
MAILTKPSAEARVALVYITGGALLGVWSSVWYLYMRESPPESAVPYYFCAGFLLTGLILIAIGFGVGHIGRAARRAELPPPEVTPNTVVADQMAPNSAIANPPVNPVAVPMASNGTVPVTATPAVPVVTGTQNNYGVQKT